MELIGSVPEAYYGVARTLEASGHETYFVGGCVRDLLLGGEPKDYDITPCATAEEVAEVFSNRVVDLVGAHFGVSLVPLGHNTSVEVATFRTDGAYGDGRRPDEVKYTKDVREDVQRRDFTVNALLMNTNGSVVDHVGGLADIKEKVLRTVGNPDDRFREDPVRMLRAIKFGCKLGLHLDHGVVYGIRDNRSLITKVAPERVNKELSDILVSGRADSGIKALVGLALADHIMPELVEMSQTKQNPKHHPEGDVLTHTCGLLKRLPKGCSLTLALGALLHDVGKPLTFALDSEGQPTFHGHEERGAVMAENILRRLKFSNDVIETVVSLVANHMRFRVLAEMRKAKQLRFVRMENFAELLELHRLDANAGSGNLANYEYAKQLLEETPPEKIRPTKLVTGFDLIKCGLKPGPYFKELLTKIEDAQLEGTVKDRAGALELVTEYIGG